MSLSWHSGITLAEQIEIERIQKSAANIILGESYESYKDALTTLGLDTLKFRRDKLSLKFVSKAEKHGLNQLFIPKTQGKISTSIMESMPDIQGLGRALLHT